MAQSKNEARHLLLVASATSPRESFGFQCGAAETLHSRVFDAFVNKGSKIGYIGQTMRPHLQPLFPCLAAFLGVWQSVDFVNILTPKFQLEPRRFLQTDIAMPRKTCYTEIGELDFNGEGLTDDQQKTAGGHRILR